MLEFKYALKMVFEQQYGTNIAQTIADNLIEFYVENGYDWCDIVDDICVPYISPKDDCFGFDDVGVPLGFGVAVFDLLLTDEFVNFEYLGDFFNVPNCLLFRFDPTLDPGRLLLVFLLLLLLFFSVICLRFF